ncbi:MAG: YjbQ family protein [Bacteroidota bacterium]
MHISTPSHNGLFDITREVEAIVSESGVQSGLVNVYVQGATAGIMIQFI